MIILFRGPEVADSSYGLIYLYNDEDINGKQNQFQVFSLARGIVKENKDPFLSLIIPTIEDEEVPYHGQESSDENK